jgi:hypothetical protein
VIWLPGTSAVFKRTGSAWDGVMTAEPVYAVNPNCPLISPQQERRKTVVTPHTLWQSAAEINRRFK